MKIIILIFSFVFSLGANQICVLLVTEDNESTIQESLKSTLGFADYCFLYDLSSKDNTVALTDQLLQDDSIAYCIQSAPKGMGLKSAVRSCLKQLRVEGFHDEETYILILDPNSRISFSGNFDKKDLTHDVISVQENKAGCCRFFPAIYKASTVLDSLSESKEVQDCAFVRVERLFPVNESDLGELNAKLEKNPKDSKLIFEKALILKDLGLVSESVSTFVERLKLEGDEEESWFSKYMLGACYEDLGDWDEAMHWYLDAFQSCPKRSEPLLKISSHYRNSGQNDLSHIFAKYGSSFTSKAEKKIFDPSFSEYLFDEDLSIVSYYTQFKEDGFIAASDLMTEKGAPWWAKSLAARNLLYYVENLDGAVYSEIEIDLPKINEEDDETYHPMNPSICQTDEGYALICRAVNYTQQGAKIFNTIDKEGIYRTKNFLLSLNSDLRVESQIEIVEDLCRDKIRPISIVQGLEDARIFTMDGAFWFTSTTRDANPGGVPQIVLCKISDNQLEGNLPVETLIPMIGPDVNRCEKNWLPFIDGGGLKMIYSCDPFVIFNPDIQTGECQPILEYKPKLDLSGFRGSAGPLNFDGGYLLLMHEVALLEDSSRVYLHRFIFLDKEFQIQKMSRPFTYLHQGIEYCCSMTFSHDRTKLIMPLGIEDNQALLCTLGLDEIRKRLLSLEDFHE